MKKVLFIDDSPRSIKNNILPVFITDLWKNNTRADIKIFGSESQWYIPKYKKEENERNFKILKEDMLSRFKDFEDSLVEPDKLSTKDYSMLIRDMSTSPDTVVANEYSRYLEYKKGRSVGKGMGILVEILTDWNISQYSTVYIDLALCTGDTGILSSNFDEVLYRKLFKDTNFYNATWEEGKPLFSMDLYNIVRNYFSVNAKFYFASDKPSEEILNFTRYFKKLYNKDTTVLNKNGEYFVFN